MSTYLITGIAGFIGSSLARALLQQGHRVRGIDNFSTGKQENISEIVDQIDFREADVLDFEAVRWACRDVDYVLHEAAIPSVPRSIYNPLETNRANVDGTLNVLVAAGDAKASRVIYAASSSAYGDTPTLPKSEAMAPNAIFGDGKQSRDFTYVENAVHANLLACKAPANDVAGKVFNVASGRRVYLNDLYRILQELTGYSAQAKYGPERRGDVKDSLADLSRVEKYLGYRPTVSPEEDLRRTVEWYRSAESEAAKRSALSFVSR